MTASREVADIVAAVKQLGDEDREALLLQLAQIDDLLDDLDDVRDIIRGARESGRPFDEFVAELRAEGRDV